MTSEQIDDPLGQFFVPASAGVSAPNRARWKALTHRVLFLAGNAVLIYHLLAIATSPSSIPPSSQLQRTSWLAFGPYLETIYLNHGWHYFAPDPGASTLLAYEGVNENGETVEGRIPDKASTHPRLLYHRYFMLTEALPRMEDADSDLRENYYQALATSIGDQAGLSEVTLTRVTHRLPTMQAVRAGFPLDDPAQYDFETLGSFKCRQ